MRRNAERQQPHEVDTGHGQMHGSEYGTGELTQGAPAVAAQIVRPNWAKIYFGCALLAVVFACGFAVGNYKIFAQRLWWRW
jgi:hypothetical protein